MQCRMVRERKEGNQTIASSDCISCSVTRIEVMYLSLFLRFIVYCIELKPLNGRNWEPR